MRWSGLSDLEKKTLSVSSYYSYELQQIHNLSTGLDLIVQKKTGKRNFVSDA